MAGTGKTGVVPVHLEGMVYERSKSESGKRVFGRVKRWDGKVPVKSKKNDFQETSSDLTNQGNLSDTHKGKLASHENHCLKFYNWVEVSQPFSFIIKCFDDRGM